MTSEKLKQGCFTAPHNPDKEATPGGVQKFSSEINGSLPEFCKTTFTMVEFWKFNRQLKISQQVNQHSLVGIH